MVVTLVLVLQVIRHRVIGCLFAVGTKDIDTRYSLHRILQLVIKDIDSSRGICIWWLRD